MHDDANDVAAIEALIRRQFFSLDWRPGKSADWDSFTADFFPDALLYPASRPAKRQTVQEFVERMKGLSGTKLESFHEVVLGNEIRVFGNVAVALAACEMTENDAQVNRGVEMMLFVKSDGEWRIVAQAWDTEDGGKAIPATLLNTTP